MNEAQGFTVSDHTEPVITIMKGLMHEAADAGIAEMIRAGRDIYQRGARLVRPALIPARASDGTRIVTPGIIPVSEPFLLRELGLVARWERFKGKDKRVRCDPSPVAAAQIMSMSGHWPFELLTATVSTPTMRADGSLLTTEGYDSASGLMLHGAPKMPPIPEAPTLDEARAALATLKTLLREFPFTSDAGRVVGLSMLITPVVRAACGDAVPLHAITAPEAGSGKSYLADLAALIATGNKCPAYSCSRQDEETEKRIGAALIHGTSIISLDNVQGTLRGTSFLCQAIERPIIPVRPLGTSDRLLIPNTVTFFMNGNNARAAGDLARRTIVGELDAETEDPLTRRFAGDPAAEIMRDRGKFVAAILTFVRAYIVAGQPGRLPPMPSFAGWSDTVRSALVWAGEADPASTNTAARDEDPNRAKLAAMLGAWPADQAQYTTAELIQRSEETLWNGELARPDFAAALRAVATDRRGRLSADRLGSWLRDNKARRAGGQKLIRAGTATRPVWGVEVARRGGDGRCGGGSSCYARESQGNPENKGRNSGTNPHDTDSPHTDGAYRDPGVTI
jgi:putative DNA primase/helicase